MILYIGIVILTQPGRSENLPVGRTCNFTNYRHLRGIKMKGYIRIFSEAAFFVGTLFIMYVWLGYIIINLWSIVNKS